MMMNRRTLLAGAASLTLASPSVSARDLGTRVSDDLRRAAQTTEGRVEIGPSTADVVVVEFFDYNCGVCRAAVPDVAALLAADRKVRLVLVDIPSLGIGSIEAGKVALGVRDLTTPETYYAFHKTLFSLRGTIDGARALQAARDLGVDQRRLIEAANAPTVGRALGANARVANALGLRVTPGYVVGNRFVAGAPGLDGLKALAAAARAGG